MSVGQVTEGRVLTAEERFRLYIDESGDHVFRHLDEPAHRYLCLLGCWFRGRDYGHFHHELEAFKQMHIPHNPDDPVILHREDIINRRKSFYRLRDPIAADAFDQSLLQLLGKTDFRIVAVVIDKKALQEQYPTPAHPYHLALGFMLQRYCGYLNHVNRVGDVLAESRGGTEDRLLKDSYARVYQRGVWMTKLADVLGHPVRQTILVERGLIAGPLAPFAANLINVANNKFNRHLSDGRVEGYGKVFFPK